MLPDGRRYPVASGRIVLLACFACTLYALGLASGGWAATRALAAVRTGLPVPWAPWLLAFIFIVSGMLTVVYGFFFRPRAVEVNAEEVALVKWDGKGATLRRAEVQSVDPAGSRIVLKGSGKSLAIAPIFQDWNRLREELSGWARTSA